MYKTDRNSSPIQDSKESVILNYTSSNYASPTQIPATSCSLRFQTATSQTLSPPPIRYYLTQTMPLNSGLTTPPSDSLDILQIRQAPQGEESHSPAVSPCLDGLRPQDLRNFPLLSRLISPISADKIVSQSGMPVFLSESAPLRCPQVQQVHLPPKSPKNQRSPRLSQLGKSRSLQSPSRPPHLPNGRSGTPTRLISTYVNDPISSPPQLPTPPLPQSLPTSSTSSQPRTRSYPNLINNYVNMDPLGPQSPRPEAVAEAECRQLRILLLAAQGRLNRLDLLERETAHLREVYASLTSSVDKQARLEVALRRSAEREATALRNELIYTQQQLSMATRYAMQYVGAAASTESESPMRTILLDNKDAHITLLQQENRKLQLQQKMLQQTVATSSPPPACFPTMCDRDRELASLSRNSVAPLTFLANSTVATPAVTSAFMSLATTSSTAQQATSQVGRGFLTPCGSIAEERINPAAQLFANKNAASPVTP